LHQVVTTFGARDEAVDLDAFCNEPQGIRGGGIERRRGVWLDW
jgi:hypothetical protein